MKSIKSPRMIKIIMFGIILVSNFNSDNIFSFINQVNNHQLTALASITSNKEETSIDFRPANEKPPDRGTPPASGGTGSRGDCFYQGNKPPLTALMGSYFLKLTIDTYPTFWIYTPYTTQEASTGRFSLQYKDDEIYQTQFKLPTTPGVVSLPLPKTIEPLEIDKEYRWYFDVDCPQSNRNNSDSIPASITGLVKRVMPSEMLENELKSASNTLVEIEIYARYGLWYETLNKLAQLKLNERNNLKLKEIWNELLKDPEVGLTNISEEPIIGELINLNTNLNKTRN